MQPPKKGQRLPRLRTVPDGVQFLNSDQAAEMFDLKQDTILKLAKRGILTPAKLGAQGRQLIFTRADLERYARHAPELAIVEALERGEAPIAAYTAAGGKVRLRELGAIIAEWARVSSYWLVQGPPGSYSRWLQRLGVLRVHTMDLRRVIETLIADDSTALKARVAFDAARGARVQAETARARELATAPSDPTAGATSDARALRPSSAPSSSAPSSSLVSSPFCPPPEISPSVPHSARSRAKGRTFERKRNRKSHRG